MFWNLQYPLGCAVEDKFLKLDIINSNGVNNPMLAGLAMGLLIQIHEAGGQGLFIPNPLGFCGISLKEKHRPDNIHIDPTFDKGAIKILGIINSDWKEEWGGHHQVWDKNKDIKPTSFCIFDASKPHSATEIFTDKKRFAIDFTVFRDQQSLEKYTDQLKALSEEE